MIRLSFDGKDFKNEKGMVVVNPEVMEMPTIKIMNMVFGASYNTWDIYRWPHGYEVIDVGVYPYNDEVAINLLPPVKERAFKLVLTEHLNLVSIARVLGD